MDPWKEFFADPLHLAMHEQRVKQEQERNVNHAQAVLLVVFFVQYE